MNKIISSFKRLITILKNPSILMDEFYESVERDLRKNIDMFLSYIREFTNEMNNLDPEQCRILNAIYHYGICNVFGEFSSNYYYPSYPLINKLIEHKFKEIYRKYDLYIGKTNQQYFYQCYKQELSKYQNLEQLIDEYNNYIKEKQNKKCLYRLKKLCHFKKTH